jgi:hypothetical protein
MSTGGASSAGADQTCVSVALHAIGCLAAAPAPTVACSGINAGGRAGRPPWAVGCRCAQLDAMMPSSCRTGRMRRTRRRWKK